MPTIVVAHDESRVIGKDNSIPWRNKEDMQFFKATTEFSAVIMGRKTWESIPDKFRPLPNRCNIILSSQYEGSQLLDSDITSPVWGCGDWENAVAVAQKFDSKSNCDGVFIIGGSQVYQSAINEGIADRIQVSVIPGTHEGDTYFPPMASWPSGWEIEKEVPHETFKCVYYKRKKDAST